MPSLAEAQWQAVEKVSAYAIKGQSGAELYASIGERGPNVGVGRAIAHTNFKLTWSRKYEPQDDESCILVSARPNLIITYTLPKAPGKLPAAVRQNWETFITGVTAHEKVHGEFIIDMVRQIEAVSVGLRAEADPDCKKIRTELTKRLGELSVAQRQRSRDFDKVELSEGGNVHQLILRLVNGY
ncbi:DUF922 domain-containing Zn-dependent protease [Rhizobium sp. LCM 4573]|uniref:DUF922 domain-containing Zn-dependent protease n=1 Tax=Rhizobium sp. LCM 4573 TaxID=1848291 RepID=UPI0008DAC671|nr:DUF922 domain-containing protein [Rhizobium sp. LCM 4573]OHV82342.1 peptidase [Rhizobium sp. LCM 4573]